MRSVKTLMVALILVSVTMAQADEQERRGPPPGCGPKLTAQQRACLEGLLGKPGEGEPPSHEEMEAAMQSCGVAKPESAASNAESDSVQQ